MLCDGMEFETAPGTLEFKGDVNVNLIDQLKTKRDYDMEEEDEEGRTLVAVEEYGSAAAQEEAKGWLSAQAL